MAVNDVDFEARLAALGFEVEARNALVSQGLRTTSDMLTLLLTTEVEKCITHLQAEQKNIVQVDPKKPEPKAAFPFVAVKNLKAFYLWIVYREVRGQPLDLTLFDADTMKKWISREAELDRSKDDREPPEPSALTSFDDWLTFEECVLTWCANTRSSMTKVPFSYLLRSHSDVTDEMRAKTYDSIDDNLMNTMLLTGPDVLHDNRQLYDHLKGWMQDGPAWSFMQAFNRSRDGRGAYLAVKAQAEGQAALMSRKAKAYASLAAARYTGRTKSFSFDSYIIKHQKAHNKLLMLEEPLTETKKVQDFLAGIHDPAFATFKGIVLGDNAKMSNFEACQQYLKTCDNVTKTSNLHSANSKREVAALKTASKKKGSKPGRGTKNGPDSPPHYGHYSSEDYRTLNPKQREKLRAKRAADGKGGGKCKASAVALEDEEEGEEADSPPKKQKTKKVSIIGLLKTTDNKRASLKTTGEEKDADDSKEVPAVTPFNPDTHGPWYDFTFGDWKDNGLGDNYPHYKGYDAKARAKAFEAYHHLDVFEREEDPIWMFNEPDKKTFEAKLHNTFNRRMGVEDKEENEKYCKAVGMGIKRFEKALSRGRHLYVAHIKRMHSKSICRCPPYEIKSAFQLFKYEKVWNDKTLVGNMKTQRIFDDKARLNNLETHASMLKSFSKETADKQFAMSEAHRLAGPAQFGRASSSKTKGKYGDNHGLEE